MTRAQQVADSEEAGWESEFGYGRPGWHVECSAFCLAMFGAQPPAPFLHSGGRDLRFPHHENEIAQSQVPSCALVRVLCISESVSVSVYLCLHLCLRVAGSS